MLDLIFALVMATECLFSALRSWYQYLILFSVTFYFVLRRLKLLVYIRRILQKVFRMTELPVAEDIGGPQNTLFDSNKAIIFPGRTTHTRLLPRVHSFTYPFLITAVPVRNCKSNWLLSVDSGTSSWWCRGWLRVEPQDHLERGGEDSLSRKLDCFLGSKGYDPARYPTVWLVTSPRFLGYKSDQASFWFLYSADRQLVTVLIEVNNTFDERRIYLLPEPPTTNTITQRPKFHHTWPKDFHVSPFNLRNGFYSCSITDLFLLPGGSPADSINITITLLSSQHRPKLVSRLWSVSEPLDPFAIPIFRALIFLASWSWQGPLIYPRTVFQALILSRRYNLEIHSRPEPNFQTIPRRSTVAERYIRRIFIEYLRTIMTRSRDKFHLHFEDLIYATDTSVTNILTLSTPNASPTSPTYALKVLTPKFYAAAVAHHTIATFLPRALLPRAIENRTAIMKSTDDPKTLIDLVKHAEDRLSYTRFHIFASNTNLNTAVVAQAWDYKTPTSVILQSLLCLAWPCLTFVRHRLLISSIIGGEYVRSSSRPKGLDIASGDPEERSKQQENTAFQYANRLDNNKLGCFLDGFVRRNYGPAEQVKYLAAVLGTAIRERILRTVGGG